MSKPLVFSVFGLASLASFCVLLASAWGEPGFRSLKFLTWLFVSIAVLANGVAASMIAGLVYEKTHPYPRVAKRWAGVVASTIAVTIGAVGIDILALEASSLRWWFLVFSIAFAVGFFILRSKALDDRPTHFEGKVESALVATGAGVGGLVAGPFFLLAAIGLFTVIRVDGLKGPVLDNRTPSAPWHLSGGYVALGDSYSSGEGQSPYEGVTRTTGCDRSLGSAYPVLLAASDWTMQPFSFRACSGGVVRDIYHIRQSKLQVSPQVVAGDSSVKLVTLTIGGNDLDFSTIVERCFGEGNCITHKSVWPKGAVGPDKNPITKTTLEQWAAKEEPTINTQVLKLLGELKGSYPNARIIVLGYPYLFPTSNASVGRGLTDCGIFLRRYSPAERNWVDWQINKVDMMYEKDAAAEGLEFISPIAAWNQHEPCGSTGQYTSAEKLNLTDFGDAFDVNGSFHPNSSGQATFAGLISCYLDEHPNAPARKTPTAQREAAAAPPSATPTGPPTDPFPADPCDSASTANAH